MGLSDFIFHFFCYYSFDDGITNFFFKEEKKTLFGHWKCVNWREKSKSAGANSIHIPLDLKRTVWCTVEWTWKCLRNWTKLTSIASEKKRRKGDNEKPIQPVFKVLKRLYVFHRLFSFPRQCFFSLEKDSLSIFLNPICLWLSFIAPGLKCCLPLLFFSPHRQANSFLISSDRSQLPAVDPHYIHIKEGCARGFIIRETFLYSFLALKPKR